MFDISELQSIEFELANKCNARCPQCPRYAHGKLVNGLNKHELSLEDIKKSISTQTIQQLEQIIFKGTTGDPIIAKDFINIIDWFKTCNPSIRIWIATNGGLHDKEYWQLLAKFLNNKDKIVFGIDGLADTHSLYRIGTNFDKVLENAQTFIKAGGNAHWQFIKFAHNEHQWQACKQMSLDLGFTNFITLHSDRSFEESYLNPPSDQIEFKQTGCVKCMSVNKKEVFVYADGSVYPCCYLGGMHLWSKNTISSMDYSMLLKITNPNIKKLPQHSLESIVQSIEFQKFSQILSQPLRPCKKYCS